MKNEVNEVVEIHEKIPNEFWGINSGELPYPRWSELTISGDIAKSIRLVKSYGEIDDPSKIEKIYDECEYQHGSHNYSHPEPFSDNEKKDWSLWNQAWRKELFKELIEMVAKNEELLNYCDEYRDEITHLQNEVEHLEQRNEDLYQKMEEDNDEHTNELNEKDKKIVFLEELNSSYQDQIDNLRFQLLHRKENVNEIA